MKVKIARRSIVSLWIGLLLLVCILVYVTNLDYAPAPFFFDEALVAAVVIKNAQSLGSSRILFEHGSGTSFFSYLPYVTASAVVTKVLGFSISSFRLTSSIFALLTAALAYLYSRQLGLSGHCAMLSSLFYLLFPAVVVQSRVAWDPGIYPFLGLASVCSLEFLLRIANGRTERKSDLTIILVSISSGILLGLTFWCYPPGQVFSALVLASFSVRFLRCGKKKGIGARVVSLVTLGGVYLIMSIAYLMQRASFSSGAERYLSESIFSHSDFAKVFIVNLLRNIGDLGFMLFDTRDETLRHVLGADGVLGFSLFFPLGLISALVIALFGGEYFEGYLSRFYSSMHCVLGRRVSLLWICWMILIGTIPTALGRVAPQTLRSAAAYPYWAILNACCFWLLIQFLSRHRRDGLILAFIGLGVVSAYQLFLFRHLIGGASFVGKQQLDDPPGAVSTYPGMSREAFGYFQYENIANKSDVELCLDLKTFSGVNLDQKTPHASAARKALILVEVASRGIDCSARLSQSLLEQRQK